MRLDLGESGAGYPDRGGSAPGIPNSSLPVGGLRPALVVRDLSQ